MSWLIHRIDDRLIHGQVVIAWGERLRPSRILIADDAAAADGWERGLLASAAPGIEVEVLSVEAAALAHPAEAIRTGGAFLLVRDLDSARRLVELGAPVEKFTIGGLHYAPGKDKVNEYVYLGAEDRRAARELLERGVRLDLQDVPATSPVALADLDASVRSA